MLKMIGAALVVFFFISPTHAQAQSSLGGSINSVEQPLPHYETRSTTMSTFAGTSDFIPSNFLSYDDAVSRGNEAIAQGRKPLPEIARETRERAKQKAQVTVVQDDSGDIIFVRSRQKQ